MKTFYFITKDVHNHMNSSALSVIVVETHEEREEIKKKVDNKEIVIIYQCTDMFSPYEVLRNIIIGISKIIGYIHGGLCFIEYEKLYDLEDDETLDDVDEYERFYGIECTVCPCNPSFLKNYNFDIEESFFKLVERLTNECGYSFYHRRNNYGTNKVQFLITSKVED